MARHPPPDHERGRAFHQHDVGTGGPNVRWRGFPGDGGFEGRHVGDDPCRRSWLGDDPGVARHAAGAAEHGGNEEEGESLHREAPCPFGASKTTGFSASDQTKRGRAGRSGGMGAGDGVGSVHFGEAAGTGSDVACRAADGARASTATRKVRGGTFIQASLPGKRADRHAASPACVGTMSRPGPPHPESD